MHQTTVTCHLKVEGLHYWKGAREIAEVDYLAHPHRHTFTLKAEFKVNHDDRDIEFIKHAHLIRDYLSIQYWDRNYKLHNFGPRSCEMIAQEIFDEFKAISVYVDEDGEHGATVCAPKNQTT